MVHAGEQSQEVTINSLLFIKERLLESFSELYLSQKKWPAILVVFFKNGKRGAITSVDSELGNFGEFCLVLGDSQSML